MDEKKVFKKKELNKDDYKKDEKVVGWVKKIGSGVLLVGTVVLDLRQKAKLICVKNNKCLPTSDHISVAMTHNYCCC